MSKELVNLLPKNREEEHKLKDSIVSYPRISCTDRQTFDLELILTGAFSPLTGFLTEANYKSVIEKRRLTDGTLWPMPIVLDVVENRYKVGEKVVLCDPYGNPLAIFTISSIYSPDKEKEAMAVYGTKSLAHPGVNYLFNHTGTV